MNNIITPGIPDDHFIRGNVPITKEEIRTLAISKLRIMDDSHVLDIGAGTGSITIEVARLLKNGYVYSVEKNIKGVNLICENIKKFSLNNVTVYKGEAPAALNYNSSINFDRVFIGGSKGNLNEILHWVDERLPSRGRVVVNAITLNTLNSTNNFFKINKYSSIEIIQASISRCEDAGGHIMFKALNPIFIIAGEKE